MSRKRTFLTVLLRCLIGVLLAAAGGCAQVQNPPQAEQANTPNPYCENLDTELARAVEEWRRPAINAKVLDRPEGDADVAAGVKVRVKLFPSEKVILAKTPRHPEANLIFYSGLASFHTGKAGRYRILLSQYLWLEMIDASGEEAMVGVRAGVLDSNKRLNRCTGMGKNLSFALKANTRYWLQLTGAKKGAIGEFVVSAPD